MGSYISFLYLFFCSSLCREVPEQYSEAVGGGAEPGETESPAQQAELIERWRGGCGTVQARHRGGGGTLLASRVSGRHGTLTGQAQGWAPHPSSRQGIRAAWYADRPGTGVGAAPF